MVLRSIQSKCKTGGRLYSIHTADLGAGRPMTGPRAWRRSGLGLRGLTGAGAGASSYSSYSSAAAASASSPSSSSHLQHIKLVYSFLPVRTSLCISPLAVNECCNDVFTTVRNCTCVPKLKVKMFISIYRVRQTTSSRC